MPGRAFQDGLEGSIYVVFIRRNVVVSKGNEPLSVVREIQGGIFSILHSELVPD
jgi:hypothetical protein